jgi:mannosyltransferase
MKNHPSIWLGLILLAGLVLRCISLDSRPIAYDDAFSFFLARQPLANIVQGTAADTMPPLYYILLHVWMQISQSVWFMRLLSVILSMAAVWVLYLLVKQFGGRTAGLWAALLAAISPLQIYHAQDLRMYALMALCQLCYLYFFVHIWQTYGSKNVHRRYWVGLVISGGLAMYTHNLAGFALVIPNLFLLVRREWKLLGRLMIAQAGIILLALPWLLFLPGQLEKIQRAFWTPQPGIVEIVQAVIMSSANLPMADTFMIAGTIASVLATALVFFESLRAWKSEGLVGIGFLALTAVSLPALLFLVSYLMRPIFVPRQFLVAMLAYLGLAGIVLSRINRRALRLFLLMCFLVACLAALPYHYAFQQFPRSPSQQATAYLSTQAQPGEIVVHDNKLSYFPALYYAPNLPQVFLPDVPGSPNDTLAPASQAAMGIYPAADLPSAVAGKTRIYFVVYQITLQEYEQVNQNHPQLEWLQTNFQQVDYIFFNDLEIYVFTP